MIKLLEKIDHQLILDTFDAIEKSIVWTEYGHKGKQTGLQYKDNEDPWTSAVGKGTGSDPNYTNINPAFKDTVFEEYINKYKLLRTRLMWVNPYACYSMHKDDTPRIHIPLITNPECYFVFQKGIISNLKQGSVWWVDTRMFHTFMNCSDYPRLHLVGVVEK
jgi:hypothetical protein